MASDPGTVAFLLEQMAGAGNVRSRAMFGEFGIYLDDKMVASVCDDQLFVKPTNAGRAIFDESQMAPPYPGAKPQFVVGADLIDDPDRLAELIRATAALLPAPKPKKAKK